MSNGKDTLKLFQNYQQDAFLKTLELTRAAWSWAVKDGQLCFLQARDPCQEASRPKGRGAEAESESCAPVESPAPPQSPALARFLSLRRREEASCAGTGRAECLSHSPACSYPPGPNHILMKEQEPSSCRRLSALNAHLRFHSLF